MRCLVCAESLTALDAEQGCLICELCYPREHTEEAMRRLWGDKCSGRRCDSQCTICQAWKFFESKGKVPSTEGCL